MEILTQPRQSGKTTKLLKMLAEDRDLIMVVANQIQRTHTRERSKTFCKCLNVTNRIHSIQDLVFQRVTTMPINPKFVIDELDMSLDMLFRGHITTATRTPL